MRGCRFRPGAYSQQEGAVCTGLSDPTGCSGFRKTERKAPVCGEGRQPEVWEPPDGGAGRGSCEGGCAKEPRLMRGGGGWGALTCFPYLCGGSWRNRGPSDLLLWAGTRGRGWQERGAEAEWAQWPAHQVLQTPAPSTCHRQDHALPWGAFSSCNHISPPLREGVKGRK